MKKAFFIFLGLIITIVIGYYTFALIIAIGSQRMSIIETPTELEELESILQKETNSGISTYFKTIPKHEYKNCAANLELKLYVYNDSLSQSKEKVDQYIQSLSKRVNQKLVNKTCIDSLIIDVTSSFSEEKIDSLKFKYYRYSFPIN